MTKKKTTSKKPAEKVSVGIEDKSSSIPPLEEMLKEITPENVHDEIPVGTVVRKRQSEQSENQSQQSG